jgi:carboxylesterase
MTVVDRSFTFPGGRTGVLLIHGLGGTPIEHRYVATGLARRGYTVSCPQLAGHCGSYADLRATGWKDWYASVEAAYRQLCKACDVVIVGGLSMGAILALHLAAQYGDEIAGTALFAPTLKLNGWGVPWYGVLFNLVHQKWCADLFPFSEREPYGIKDPRVRALVTNAINSGDSSQAGQLTNPGSSMLEMRWLINTVKRELGKIRQPTLIIHPREDDRAGLANAEFLQKRLAGLVDTCVLDDSYHVITMDRQREIVVQRTSAFAARVVRIATIRKRASVESTLARFEMAPDEPGRVA